MIPIPSVYLPRKPRKQTSASRRSRTLRDHLAEAAMPAIIASDRAWAALVANPYDPRSPAEIMRNVATAAYAIADAMLAARAKR